ncbi:hypothetical protein C8024_08310 [Sphingopyxis sp. BSNA05]|uniref:hypothetical protein n=1 Tax=Sphingopyxis sp. BSNA05 TaxID=1236614 RepID=UPI001563B5C3|nr:hypothetical protein [Sphingopyxis sp. BSNA05]NRD89449.1 hypothetical protein [Sphingopyxis sp. BSNA05]
MPLETILLFVVADLMFCFTPGPATMVIVSHALPHGPAGGMRGALGPIVGVNLGNADQVQPLLQKIAAAILFGSALTLAWWNLNASAMQSAFNLPQGAIG